MSFILMLYVFYFCFEIDLGDHKRDDQKLDRDLKMDIGSIKF